MLSTDKLIYVNAEHHLEEVSHLPSWSRVSAFMRSTREFACFSGPKRFGKCSTGLPERIRLCSGSVNIHVVSEHYIQGMALTQMIAVAVSAGDKTNQAESPWFTVMRLTLRIYSEQCLHLEVWCLRSHPEVPILRSTCRTTS
jgi:hypothetical protein